MTLLRVCLCVDSAAAAGPAGASAAAGTDADHADAAADPAARAGQESRADPDIFRPNPGQTQIR